jgi:hypothetical protein
MIFIYYKDSNTQKITGKMWTGRVDKHSKKAEDYGVMARASEVGVLTSGCEI